MEIVIYRAKKLIPYFLINIYHFLMAFFSALFYGFPSKKLKVIGVTGTSGKSTTIDLITRILEQAGYKTAALSSIKFKIAQQDKINELRMTMPGRGLIQKFLRQAKNAKCEYVILEVTSEGIVQHRHRFIDFDCAVFTNLSPEHIEAHGSFENYKKAKAKFFKVCKNTHIINLDDEHAQYFLQFPANKKYTYQISKAEGLEGKGPTLKKKRSDLEESRPEELLAQNIQVLFSGIKFSINETDFNLKLLGKFNIYNALAAICIGLSQGVDLMTCKNGLEKVKGVPGRMELVISKPFQVFVDYAITPNALEQVYKMFTTKRSPTSKKTRSRTSSYKLICVLGACGGGRDKWKRPVLGKLASQYCDKIIITNEDPYNENPMDIINQIASGIENISVNQFTPLDNFVSNGASQRESSAFKILDRRQAIKKALESAKPGDVVIITGKGCEPSMCLAGGKRIPWSDKKVILEEYEKI